MQLCFAGSKQEQEGDSVELISSNKGLLTASVNNTILKPWLALAACRQGDFPDVKFRVATLI